MNQKRALENLTDFEKIITALKANDGKTASSIIMVHVRRFNNKMQENK